MGWLDIFKKKKEDADADAENENFDNETEEENVKIRLCQGCGKKEDEENKLRILKQNTTDGMYTFLFCRKCYRMMKKGKMPPLIAQMQAQQR